MIPTQLTLKNFMSYGDHDTTLSFEGLHVACLSGDNGNGKSALLDAITWALWGETRASSVSGISDDDLIRVGTDEMEVRYDFEISGGNYRVIRKRKRGKTGEWQFLQKDSNEQFHPIGGTSTRETKENITHVLKMKYETFLNSAYLQQGHADEFTRQRPADRKRILGEILGLEQYEILEKKAKERRDDFKSQGEELEREMQLLEAETSQLPQHRERLEAILADLKDKVTEATAKEKIASELAEQKSQLDAQWKRVEDAQTALQRLDTERLQQEKDIVSRAVRIAGLQETLKQKPAVLADYERLQQARKQRESLDEEIAAYNKVRADLQEAISQIKLEGERLQGELRTRESELKTAERQATEMSRLKERLLAARKDLADGPKIERELAEAAEAQEREQTEFGALKARNKAISDELEEIKEALEVLNLPRAVCPVCDTDLSGDKRARVIARQEEKAANLRQEQEALKRQGSECNRRLKAAQEQVQSLTKTREAFEVQRSQIEELEAQVGRLKTQLLDVDALRKEVGRLCQQIEKETFAEPVRVRKGRLEKDFQRLTKVKEEYDALSARIRQLDEADTRFQALQRAETTFEQENTEKKRLEALLIKKQEECETERKRLEKLRVGLEGYEQVRQAAAAAEAERNRLQTELQALRLEEDRAKVAIARGEQSEQRRKVKAEEKKKADEQKKIYTALAQAFGKKGIPTYIIERTLPELEDEANELLARMTDNAMHVSFRTVRAARSTGGSEIETLDIQITDDVGTRPYELFSGGEGFRVNFAIRIALSRLLARRSGAKLQTLIMDEGFGSQDGKGREKLLEVIEAIKNDFEKIIVITHFEEMKDAFSQRIEVVKGPDGSHIHLL